MSAPRRSAPWRLALVGLLVLLLPLKTLAALLGAPGCAGHRLMTVVAMSSPAVAVDAADAGAAVAERLAPCHEHGGVAVSAAATAADTGAADDASTSTSAGCCHCAPCNAGAAPAPERWQAPEPGPMPAPAVQAEHPDLAVVAEVPHQPPRHPR